MELAAGTSLVEPIYSPTIFGTAGVNHINPHTLHSKHDHRKTTSPSGTQDSKLFW